MARRRAQDEDGDEGPGRASKPARKRRGEDPLGELRHRFFLGGLYVLILLPLALLFSAAAAGLIYGAFVTPVWLLFAGLALVAMIAAGFLWTLVYAAIADRNKVTAELRADGLRWWSGFGNPLEVRWADVTAVEVKRTATPHSFDR